MIRFLCGCQAHETVTRENMSTMELLGYDEEGFVICKVHGARRYGWRSPNHRASFAGMTDLEYQNYMLFGEKPETRKHPAIASTAPDLRPHIYESMFDARANLVIAQVNYSASQNGS